LLGVGPHRLSLRGGTASYEVEETMGDRTGRSAWKSRTMEAGRIAKFWFRKYNFSPPGATFQRQEQRVNLHRLTHLRLTIVPKQKRLRYSESNGAPPLRLSVAGYGAAI